MPTSQNGYPAPITPVSRALPGGKVPLRAGATGDLLAWVGQQFHSRVEALIWPGCWGYAYRDIRGATSLSNHASGTALDLNAPRHPLNTAPSANYSAAQIAAIHAIVGQTDGCVRWGGDYTGRKDGMHFEIVASEARCAAVLAKLTASGGSTPTPSTGQLVSTEDNLITLPASMNTTSEVIAVPADCQVTLWFAAKTTIFGGHVYNWSTANDKGTAGDPVSFRIEPKQGYGLSLPRGTCKAEVFYSCASPVSVFVEAVK